MIIKGITVRIPPLLLGLTVLFAVVCAMSFAESGEWIYVWMGVPLCIVLLAFPLLLMYSNEKQVLKNKDAVRAAAHRVKAHQISSSMRGVPVIFEGEVVKISGLQMNKPTYIIKDGSGQVAVRRFALPERLFGVGAHVEVLGTVYGKVGNERSVFINALTITPTVAAVADVAEEKIHIKKYN